MISVEVPEGKTIYGYGGQKYKSGMTINDKQVSAEVIKKLSGGPSKKLPAKKNYVKKSRRRKIEL